MNIKALIEKAALENPIPPDVAYVGEDNEAELRREQEVVQKWMHTDAPSDAPAATDGNVCDLVAEIVTPIVERMARQIDELQQANASLKLKLEVATTKVEAVAAQRHLDDV